MSNDARTNYPWQQERSRGDRVTPTWREESRIRRLRFADGSLGCSEADMENLRKRREHFDVEDLLRDLLK